MIHRVIVPAVSPSVGIVIHTAHRLYVTARTGVVDEHHIQGLRRRLLGWNEGASTQIPTQSTAILVGHLMEHVRKTLTLHTLSGSVGAPLSSLSSRAHGRGQLLAVRWLFFRDAMSTPPNGRSDPSGGRDNSGADPSVQPEKSSDDDNPEGWLLLRVLLFVFSIFILTMALYQLSKPTGMHVGWHSLKKHVAEIQSIALYEHFAQVYLDTGKVHLGLYHDQDTQHRMDEIEALYAVERQNAKQKASAERALRYDAVVQAANKENDEEGEVAVPPSHERVASRPDNLLVVYKGRPVAETALQAIGVFAWVVPFVFFPVFVMFLSQYIGKSMSAAVEATSTKSKVKEMIFRVEKSSSTRFRDIAGMKEPKREITEIVDFLRHPDRYTKLGAKIPTGGLLLGPPGTGKTLLAKAVAGESDVGFIPVCGSDFVELYVGMGALRVRQLFKEAKKQRCIIYIDEIDAIGLKRQGSGQGEKQEQEQTLNELLTQLDGFSSSKRGEVMVLASSNVAQEALDPALIRPGRFDRIIHVDAPVVSERVDIFKVHLSKLKLVATPPAEVPEEEADQEIKPVDETAVPTMPDITRLPAQRSTEINLSTETRIVVSTLEEEKKCDADILEDEKDGRYSYDFRSLLLHKSDQERALIDAYASRMSNLCPGFVGSDIANVCNEGAILASREGATHVAIKHLERSIDRVIAGIEHRSRVLSDFEKKVVAHHEAGHAVAGWFLNRADPLMKVSIVPRGGSALGYAQYLPNENYSRTAKEIRDSISVTLGGRVAERIFFDHLSTGASDDLRKVGHMAYMYVSSFAPGSVYPAPGTSRTRVVKPFGTKKSNELDEQAKNLVDEVYADTYNLLLKHKGDMEALAQHLLKHELLTYQDVVNYLGSRGERPMDRRKGV